MDKAKVRLWKSQPIAYPPATRPGRSLGHSIRRATADAVLMPNSRIGHLPTYLKQSATLENDFPGGLPAGLDGRGVCPPAQGYPHFLKPSAAARQQPRLLDTDGARGRSVPGLRKWAVAWFSHALSRRPSPLAAAHRQAGKERCLDAAPGCDATLPAKSRGHKCCGALHHSSFFSWRYRQWPERGMMSKRPASAAPPLQTIAAGLSATMAPPSPCVASCSCRRLRHRRRR